MSFERLRNEEPGKYYSFEEIQHECKKLGDNEVMPNLFWLVNSFGRPVTRKEKLKHSNPGDTIVFGFQKKIIHEAGKRDRAQLTALELTGQNKVDFIEHPLLHVRQLLRDYEAAGFMKVEKDEEEKAAQEKPDLEKPVRSEPILGDVFEKLRADTTAMYRAQVEEILERLDPGEENMTVSDKRFASALSRLNTSTVARPHERETKSNFSATQQRNIEVSIKCVGNMMVPRESDEEPIQLKPGLIIRMKLPERKGSSARAAHSMPEYEARTFAGITHIIRHPELYPESKAQLDRLGIKLVETQTREWLEPPMFEEHQNLRIVYERRELE